MGPFIYFLLKNGGQSYTQQRWKRGLFGTHIRTMPYIGSYPPPRPPPPHPLPRVITILLLSVHFYRTVWKTGRIMLRGTAFSYGSVRKLYLFRLTSPTVYIRSGWNLVYSSTMLWSSAYCFVGYSPPNVCSYAPLKISVNFYFRLTPPTFYIRSSWNFIYS